MIGTKKMNNNGKHRGRMRNLPGDATSLERFAQKNRHLYGALTEDERELLKLLALEWKRVDIADQLGISPELLLKRKGILQEKLSANCPADYVKFAMAFGLIHF